MSAIFHIKRYNRDPALPVLEAEARSAGRGLWALPEAQRVPPWEWRKTGAAGRDEARRQEQVEQDRVQEEEFATPVARRRSSSRGGGGGAGYAAGGSAGAGTGGFACGGKRTCGQMSSCAEARFYYRQCGLSRLDRDRDGVPCESLCR